MKARVSDKTGLRYGRLLVIRRGEKNRLKQTTWVCRCDCGNETSVVGGNLASGHTTSCGCKKVEVSKTCGGNGIPMDLTGHKFGRLTAVELAGRGKRKETLWKCVCECGKEVVVSVGHLRNGDTKSCGCYAIDSRRKYATTHGMTDSPEHRVWGGIVRRCYNQQELAYKDYGGRGIKVCERWLDAFENFYEDMGPRPPKMTLDRIDNNGNYSCGHCEECQTKGWSANCRWLSRKEQNSNKRNNVVIEFDGKSLTLDQWADKLQLSVGTLRYRLFRCKWPLHEALSPEKRPRKKGRRPDEYSNQELARRAVKYALRNKRMVRPSKCEIEGCENTTVQAHHHLGYDEAHWLDVQWICKMHHTHAHMRVIEFNGEKKTVEEWASQLGLKTSGLLQRLRRPNWTLEMALTTPKITSSERKQKPAFPRKRKAGRHRHLDD